VFFTEKFLTKTIRCAGAFVKEKPTVGAPFFGEFPSDRFSKAIKGIFLYYIIIANPVHYTSEFWEVSEATACK